MPFLDAIAPELTAPRAPEGVAPPKPLDPTIGETVAASFRSGNTLVNTYRTLMEETFPPQAGYNPLDDIRGTDYEALHSKSFTMSQSPAETGQIKAKIDGEDEDRKIRAASGFAGFVADVVAGGADPTLAMPAGVVVKSARGGYSAARSVVSVGGAVALQTAVQEAALQTTQETRTLGESAGAVGSAAILGGFVGLAASRLLSSVEHKALESLLDRDRADIDAHAMGRSMPAVPRVSDDVLKEQVGKWTAGVDGGADLSLLPEAVRRLGSPIKEEQTLYRGEWPGRPDLSTESGTISVSDRQGGNSFGLIRNNHVVEEFDAPEPRPAIPLSEIIIPKGTTILDAGPYAGKMAGEMERILPPGRYELVGTRREPYRVTDVNVDQEIKTYRFQPDPLPHAETYTGSGMAGSAGAAARDTRQLEMFKTPMDRLGLDKLSVTRRTMGAESPEARRAMADLAEMPYRFKENEEGVATTQGPAVDRIARTEINSARVAVADDVDRFFSDYRFGQADKSIPRLRSRIEDVTGGGDGKMSLHEFKQEVSIASMNGDKHAIPQVEQAAQAVRARVFEPWAERAEEVIDGFKRGDQAEGESYFPHVWNKEVIKARRPEFTNKLVEKYDADQTVKRGIQERVGYHKQALDLAEGEVSKLTAKVKALEEDVEVVQARQEEATRLNKFSVQRATELRESQFVNDGGVRKEAPGKNIEKARGGAVFETNVRARGNELADKASGKLAQIEALELKIQTEIGKANEMRAKIEAELGKWDGSSATEAKAAMTAREAADAARTAEQKAAKPRLESADTAIDRTVKRILESDRNVSVQELRAQAQQTVDRLLSSPDGRLPYDFHTGGPRIGAQEGPPPRGALAGRRLNVTNAWAKDWIETDIEHVAAMHLRTIVPDVVLTERFGDVEMSQSFRKINESYANLIDATKSEKERVRLGKERDAAIRDVAAVRDRVRGVYGFSPELANMARVANAAKAVNNLTSMGSVALSSLPDMAGVVIRYGFTTALRDGWTPFFKGLVGGTEEWGKFKTQMRAIGIGIETATNARQHSLDDVVDTYRPQSRIERVLQGASDKFFIANLLAPLTDAQKLVAAHVAVSEILRTAKAAAAGTATKRQIGNLAESGIDIQMAGRIWRQFDELKRGSVIDGVHLPNTQDWTDRIAADALNGAVSREVDIAVVTPGQEKPLWMSKPVISLLGQFKAFTAASTERILVANMQRRDASALSGLVFSVGMGMMTYKLNAFFGGTKTSDRPQDWIKEGISRGGLLGWFEEGNALASKASRGSADIYRLIGADKPLGKFASRSAADMLLGPTWGKIETLPKITSSASSGEWSASDTSAVRRLIAGQNLFYIRRLLNQVEESANSSMHVEPKPQK